MKSKTQRTIRVTEQELYELNSLIISQVTNLDPSRFNRKLQYETERTFGLLGSLNESQPAKWFPSRTFMMMAALSFVLLAGKILIESHFNIH
jgi:hypothetical protein